MPASLPSTPSNTPAALKGVIDALKRETESNTKRLDEKDKQIRTLESLLGGVADRSPVPTTDLGPVAVMKIGTSASTITFYLPTTSVIPDGVVLELYRSVGAGSTSIQAQRTAFVAAPALVIQDSPPVGETYRYYLRYSAADGSRAGPFSPLQGVIFTVAAAADPESGFDPRTSGVFLETFETQGFETQWQKYDGGAPTISYPNTGIVGGLVARVAGAEEWRAFKRIFEFEPGQLYRMKVGVRLTVAPSNGSSATKARLRAGFMCFDVDRNILDTAGGSGFTGAHWFCAFDKDLGAVALTTYQEFTGYLQGLGTTPANNASDVSNPSVARSGTKYWTPVIDVNYDDGNGTTEIDYIRVERLNPLDVAFGGELSTDSVTLPADNAGNILSYAGAAGTFNVRYGVQPIDPSRIAFTISANPQTLTASINASGVFLVTTGFDAGEAVASITFRATYNGAQIDRTFSLAKALAGADGADGTVTGVRLLSDNQIFTFDASGTASPASQTITFTSLRNGVTDPTTWTTDPSVTLGGVGDTRTLTDADFGANTSVKVRAESEGYFDEITVHRVQQGRDSIIAFLTNEAVTLPASESGVVSSYTGANGVLTVFSGITDVTAAATKTVQSNPQSLTITGPNSTTGAWSVTGGFDAGENTAIVIFRAVYGGVTIDRQFFLAKAFTGAAGEDGNDGTDGTPGAAGPAGAPGPALFTLIADANVVLTSKNSVKRTGGVSAWDAAAHTGQSFPSCFITWRPNDNTSAFMCGFTRNPAASLSYTNAAYAIYCAGNAGGAGRLLTYKDGVAIKDFGAGQYTNATIFTAAYDGHTVRLYKGSTLLSTFSDLGATFFGFIPINTLNCEVLDIGFGPMGKSGDLAAQLVFLETWETQQWEAYYAPFASSAGAGTGGTVTYPNNGEFGGKVLSSAGGTLWISALDNVPYDPNSLYKITAKVRRTVASSAGAGTSGVLIGVNGVAADGVTLINANGANAGSSQFYNCFSNVDMSTFPLNQWVEQTGYFRGNGTGGGSGASPFVDIPLPLYTGVRYIRPVVILNFAGGNGTQECDYIRVERLNAPDDADNTDKRRIVPDAEFNLGNLGQYWFAPPGATGAILSTTGGQVGGRAIFNGNNSLMTLYSKRNPSVQGSAGQALTITVRWRRTGALFAFPLNPVFSVYAIRHGTVDGNFNPATGSYTAGNGGVGFIGSEINARAFNAWQEDIGVAVLPPDFNLVTPYVALAIDFNGSPGSTIEVDFANITVGAPAFIPRLVITSLPRQGLLTDVYKNIVYDSPSAGTYTLGRGNGFIGMKYYFEQAGTGALTIQPTIAAPANTMRSSPNRTDNRTLQGRSAKAMAEFVEGNTWVLTGQLS